MTTPDSIDNTFQSIYSPLHKAIGECLLSIGTDQNIDTSAVIATIISVAIDLAKNSNEKAKSNNQNELLINFDLLVKFAALQMSIEWKLEPELSQQLQQIAFSRKDNVLN